MPDDLQIPIASAGPGGRAPLSASYRPRAAGHRASCGLPLRTALLAGGTAAGLLLAAVGGWALLHRHPAAVPVIEADTRPIRVKPENPGGMTVADADDPASPGEQRMAPAAEAPAPQALRAQMQPPPAQPDTAAPQAAFPPPQQAPQQSATLAPPPAGVSPLPDTPRPAARTPTATPAATPAARPPAPGGTAAQATTGGTAAQATTGGTAAQATTGGTAIQVAAVDSEAAAQTEWQRLQKRMPELLGDRHPLTVKAERDGKPIWRVRIPGFADTADATAFCAKLRARGGNCAIASF